MSTSNGVLNGHVGPSNGTFAGSTLVETNAPIGFDTYSDLHVAYDLILSDGHSQLKCVLSPQLSIHLEKGGILPLGIIQVTQATIRFDETILQANGIFVIKQINIIEEKMNDIILVRRKRREEEKGDARGPGL